MSDRELQDDVIRALADASFRQSQQWLARGLADPAKVQRFGYFLARHFYYERIIHFFKYSRALAKVTRRPPDNVLNLPEFDATLPSVVLGSRATATAVARLVENYVATPEASAKVPYLKDLLRYETAMMLTEAGPRQWRDTQPEQSPGESQNASPAQSLTHANEQVVRLAPDTQFLELEFAITDILPALLQPWSEPPGAPRNPIRLMFARSEHGRVVVAHSDAAMERLLQLADPQKSFREMLAESGLDEAELRETLEGLAEWGAVRISIGS